MKGISQVIAGAVTLLLIITILEGIYLANFVYRSEFFSRAVREAEVITAINAVEFAKKSMQLALNYSSFQAFYDVGKRGGYKDIPANVKSYDCTPYYWFYDVKNCPDDMMSNLEDVVLKYFDCYGQSYSSNYPGVKLSVPSYTKPSGTIKIEDLGDQCKVDVNNLNKIGATGDFYNIMDNANFVTAFETNLTDYFKAGKESFCDVSQNPLRDIVMKAITDGGYSYSGGAIACGSCPTWSEVFTMANLKTPDTVINEIKGRILMAVSTLNDNLKAKYGYDCSPGKPCIELIPFSPDGLVDVVIDNNCQCTEGSCCRSDCECWYDPCCTGDPCGSTDEEGNCVSTCESCCYSGCCANYETTTCTFTIYAAANILIKLTDASTTPKYLVYDGTFSTKSIQLKARLTHQAACSNTGCWWFDGTGKELISQINTCNPLSC